MRHFLGRLTKISRFSLWVLNARMIWCRTLSQFWLRIRSWIIGNIFKILVTGLVAFLMIHVFSPYSGGETFTLISRTVLTDLWHVPGSMSCSTIDFHGLVPQVNVGKRDFHAEWKNRFDSPDVVNWRKEYLSRCAKTEKSLSAVLSAGRLTSPGLGLACNTNFALNVLLLANDSASARNFQLLIVDWNYVSWSALFHDFSAESACPIVRETDWVTLEKEEEKFGIFWANGNWNCGERDCLNFGTQTHLQRELNSEGWENFQRNLGHMEGKLGREEMFRKKSVVARAFLQLQPSLKETFHAIWNQLTQNGNRGYSVVHIRRGDKIAAESVDFPILLYFRALRRLCHLHPGRCSRTVYLFCDDAAVCQKFKSLTKNCFEVLDFRQCVQQGRILPWYNNNFSAEFKSQTHFNQLPAEDRLASAKEMLISIYLAAFSDFFICTYSSNICRLVALLKNGDINQLDILSLDWLHWTVL